jgi:hypothetical protein
VSHPRLIANNLAGTYPQCMCFNTRQSDFHIVPQCFDHQHSRNKQTEPQMILVLHISIGHKDFQDGISEANRMHKMCTRAYHKAHLHYWHLLHHPCCFAPNYFLAPPHLDQHSHPSNHASSGAATLSRNRGQTLSLGCICNTDRLSLWHYCSSC